MVFRKKVMSHIYLNCIYYGCKCQGQMQVLSIVLIIQLRILLFSFMFLAKKFSNFTETNLFLFIHRSPWVLFSTKIRPFGHFPLNHILFLKSDFFIHKNYCFFYLFKHSIEFLRNHTSLTSCKLQDNSQLKKKFRRHKGRIFSEKYWYYFHCPKNVLCSILSFVF